MSLVLVSLLYAVAAYALVSAGCSRAALRSHRLMKASLAVGFGIGIFGITFFVARIFGAVHLLWVDLAVPAAILIVSLPLWKSAKTLSPLDQPELAGSENRLLTAGVCIALIAAICCAIARSFAYPHGNGWDAFSIWNLHARFLFRSGTNWSEGFSPLIAWSHPDYPLLLPAAIAHFWNFLGRESQVIPSVIGLAFTFATAGLLFSSLSILRGRVAAMLGTLTLLSTPFFVELGTSQYADVPLAFFDLAAVALLCIWDHYSREASVKSPRGLLILAGLAAGFSALTKNEGLLFLCALGSGRLFVLIRTQVPARSSASSVAQEQRRAWSEILIFLGSAIPALALIAWFKHSVAPASELFADHTSALQKLQNPSRYWAILKWFEKDFLRFGNWLLIPGTLLLLGWYLLARRKTGQLASFALAPTISLTLILAGYFVIYLITPYEIYWHLRFSLDRLLLQLWPSTIFLVISCSCMQNPAFETLPVSK